ncbi:FAD-dependent thymidylate synthase [Candidatus Woesearchaeota archaeon]|jgi:thymidylate synthase (FAD)|nr:FAD-dependent thymidylate synthase [Candidatus Woesearchaeota archaeon]MBT3463343.1 FAD-dependent thymidylate synthase [archaeon]MBT4835091.1 FAD-dependent thymidylate synthase [Candidatus Woesearchaeota archaeon]MBT6734783.1 FAD-dependent thymidylate synthase [Candidatus Woesearchaeota archaeon]MBT7170034.1 FAD-dependent thymidylate synthase [Candidatus Woesearchaeota archaeon]
MNKPENKEANSIIGKEYKCLDNGFVRLIDYMGDDAAIVQAARVSYGKGTKSTSEDEKLLRYMMRNGHSSPFEMVELKFHAKMPIFVARQWIRYRTANINEYSMRYSEPMAEAYVPKLEDIRLQSTTNKQGGSKKKLEDITQQEIKDNIENHNIESFKLYNTFNGQDIARELARTVLPVGTYTEWYWKNDLRNTFHFLNQRLDAHAQPEIKVYAESIAKIVKKIVPIAYSSFEDYILNATTFSAQEMNSLEMILKENINPELAAIKHKLEGRELSEFLKKINVLANQKNPEG